MDYLGSLEIKWIILCICSRYEVSDVSMPDPHHLSCQLLKGVEVFIICIYDKTASEIFRAAMKSLVHSLTNPYSLNTASTGDVCFGRAVLLSLF